MILKILIFLYLINLNVGSNILLFYGLFAKSHLYSFLPLLQQLSSDGHNITVFYVDSSPPPDLGFNISTINSIMERDKENVKEMVKSTWTTVRHGQTVPVVFYLAQSNYNNLMEKNAEQYSQALSGNYDFIIVDELFTLHGIAAAKIFKKFKNIPYAIFSSSLQTHYYQHVSALSRNFVSSLSLITPLPSNCEDFYDPKSFFQRVINVLENYSEIFAFDNILPYFIKFHITDGNIREFYHNAHLTFGEHIDRLGNIQSVAADLALVGSNCKSGSKIIDSTLPNEWKTFVEHPKSKGTIYIAFGTAIRWDGAPQNAIDAFVDAINELDEYQIVFSWNGKFPSNVKSHIKFTKWAPQMQILMHPKTVLFVTHGGLKSLKESLCAEVPVILMPMFAEQSHNAKYALKLGIGTVLNKFELTSKKIVTQIRKIATNKKYHQRLKFLKKIYLDRKISPLEYGSHKLSKLLKMRQKFGSFVYDKSHEKLFKRKGRFLESWEFFGIDLILVFVFSFIFIISK